MVGIKNDKIDEIGEKLGVQRSDLKRRKHYFLKIILKYILELLIIIISASMGLYINAQITHPKYPYTKNPVLPAAIFGVPILFLLMGLNSGNPDNSIRSSGLKIKIFRGFSVIYLITTLFLIFDTFFNFLPNYNAAMEYGVFKKKKKNLLLLRSSASILR